MGPRALLLLLLLLLLPPALLGALLSGAEDPAPPALNDSRPAAPPRNGTRGWGPGGSGSPLLRSVLVVAGLGVVAVVYFLVRTYRVKQPQGRRYGLLAHSEDPADLGSLDSEEETVFQTRSPRW